MPALILPKLSLRNFNNLLSIVVLLLGVYVIAVPFLPQIAFWLSKPYYNPPAYASSSPIKENEQDAEVAPRNPPENMLIIPSLQLEQVINEGDVRALRKGVWHRPLTSAPDLGGNMVLVGHRFTYDDPAVFYHLDKIKQDDQIMLFWKGKRYDYTVSSSLVVPPSATWVEADSEQPMLTLYTCTPLWSAKERLVIQAQPIRGDQ